MSLNTTSLHDTSYDLLSHFAPSMTSYLGIGVQEGVCVEQVVRANPHIRVTLCDTWGLVDGGTGRGDETHVEVRLREAGHKGSRHYLTGESQRLIPQLSPGTIFDLAYVDGCHAEEAALADLQNTWPRVAKVMLVHDIKMPQVWSALLRWMDGLDPTTAWVSVCVGGYGTAIVWRLR